MNAGTNAADPAENTSVATRDLVAGWMHELVPYGIFTTDSALRINTWNRWLAVHSGKSAEEVLGRALTDVYPDLQARHLLERFLRALSGEVSVISTALHKYLLPFPSSTGEAGVARMFQTARIAPLEIAGRIVGTITIIEDVTQREIQAAILNKQRELERLLSGALGTLLQSTNPAREMDGIFSDLLPALGLDAFLSYLLEDDSRTLRLNASAGVAPRHRELLVSLTLMEEESSELRGADPLAKTICVHVKKLQGIGVRGHCCFPLRVGERLIGLVSFASYYRDTVPPSDTSVLSRVALYVSVALDRMAREQEVQTASRAKDDFLAALSHELRTPLNPVLLLASESAGNPEFPASARDIFQVIEKNVLLEARLIDDLLDLTRIARGKMNLEWQTVDLHDVLRDAMAMVRGDVAGREVLLVADLQAEATQIWGDYGRLQQVFWNVLKNAVKFMPFGGTIRVSSQLDVAKKTINVSITDTGIGMKVEELGRIFKPFTQGDHARQNRGHRFGGLGLGLAISHEIVQLHSGQIEAASPGKGQGSTFTIYLPLGVNHGVSGRPLSDEEPVKARSQDCHETQTLGRILLVEDHEPTRVALAELLGRRGYRVTSVGSLGAALHEASAATFDLVLSDIGLPDGDGYTLMKALRDRYGLKGLALTGYGMEKDIIKGTEAGFIHHLIKPISTTVLDRLLSEILSTGKTQV